MERRIGTVSRGLRAPIIKEGDDLKTIVVDTLMGCIDNGDFEIGNKDVLAVTESILARSQANYATTDQLAKDVRNKLGGETVGVVFPILSRNRFAICLRGIAKGAKKVVLMLSYPSDEVGNHLLELDLLDEKGIDPYKDVLTQEEFENIFGKSHHTFTDIDYVNYYKDIIKEEGAEAEIIFANNPRSIVDYAENVICADIHTRARTKRLIKNAGAKIVLGMDDLLNESVDGSGYNPEYGILGSNKATEDSIKLFPVNCQEFVNSVQEEIRNRTGKTVEVMVYGDGAFKDPVGKIWELADPVVSPGFTSGLVGQPNEVKLKYLADNDFADLRGEELKSAIQAAIKEKEANLVGKMVTEGTTPRRLTDLLGSLCDLTSGSGDKGTPFIYIQGYFDNYTD
ncbi:MAG: F420-0--gamma-glutamyl ligase [Clostridiales bacterium]|nr:coenzyme F420-0:L-glutamate ligase [Bacillota bacterium]MEE0516660.1 coenzyme F420-0:L-glutamate ligase [Anaerovoracaceae bacterium]PWL93481.1 MAG: F420-0--gamma-glutamyl ligase [Clostridiales bacterium]